MMHEMKKINMRIKRRGLRLFLEEATMSIDSNFAKRTNDAQEVGERDLLTVELGAVEN